MSFVGGKKMSENYYILLNGRIKRHENTLYFENSEGEKRPIPIEMTKTIHVFGEVDINTKALNFLSKNEVELHYYNYYGFYSGSILPRKSYVSGNLLIKQVQNYLDQTKRFYLAYCFVDSAIFHILRNLREHKEAEEFVTSIEKEKQSLAITKTIQELMGVEGRIRNLYYQAFNTFLKEDFNIEKREKNPPSNPLNALISFGNSLMYSTVLSEIYHTQLDPTISYLHEPGERRFSLCLDISEIFKPLIIDSIIFKLINNNQIKLEHFDQDLNYCYLNNEGRKIFLKEYEQKLNTTIYHRKLNRNVSYKGFIRHECYKIIKHLLNDEVYSPLKAWW